MPIPGAVTDAFNKIDVVGLPSQANPGQLVSASLSPSPVGLDLFKVAKTLAELDIGVDLTPGSITTTLQRVAASIPGISSTTLLENLTAVSKAVEFATTDETKADVAGKLPYVVPLSTPPAISSKVQGTIAGVTGELKTDVSAWIATLSGGLVTQVDALVGKITGTIKEPALITDITYTVKWHVRDESGTDLADGTHFKATPSLTTFSVGLAFFPEFTEFTSGSVPTSQRNVSCEVALTVTEVSGTQTNVSRTIGPFGIQVPKIPVPAVAVFTQHANFTGHALVAVPSTSPFGSLAEINGVLQGAASTLNTVKALTTLFNPTLDALNTVSAALSLPTSRFVKSSRVNDLGSICFETGFLGFCSRSAIRLFSSLAVLGPGRNIECHNLPNQWVHHGVFVLSADSTGVGLITDFSALGNTPSAPAPMPGFAGPGTCTITRISDRGRVWNDTMESYQFI